MCGIAGIVDFSGRPVARGIVARMTQALSHRGPDDEGVWLDPGGTVGLGHRRLAIRDLSPAGHQPMHDASGRVSISYNGEIYNDAALRRELEREHGARFRSRCDAEVIPAGFLAWGEGLFDRLEGMFAIALWDAQERTLWLARDGVGVKPLFVSHVGARTRFASEVKGLLADPEQPFRLAPEALHAYLAQGYVGPTKTLLEDVAQVPPGTVRRVDVGGVRDRRFWSPQRRPDIRRLGDACEAFASAWREVLHDQRVSDVPVGVLQSGGIDSALVVFGLRGHADLPVFTARFQEKSHDEGVLAAATARAVGARHHTVLVETGDVVSDFRAMVHAFDGQVADSSGLAFFALARSVRQQTAVALSGDGADEFFGGYPTYAATRLAARLGAFVPRRLANGAAIWAQGLAAGRSARLPAAELAARLAFGLGEAGIDCHAVWRRLLAPHQLQDLYGPALVPLRETRDPLAGYIAALHEAEGGLVDRALLADQRFYLPADMLQKVDAMSMAHALEVRVPFLDRRIMDLAGRMDARLLVPWRGPTKRVLREVLRRAGGPAAVVRGRKRGFNVPLVLLLRGALAAEGDRLLDVEAERLAPFLAPDGVRRLWRGQRDGTLHEPHGVFALLSLATWLAQCERPHVLASSGAHG